MWNCVCRHTRKPIILKGYVKVMVALVLAKAECSTECASDGLVPPPPRSSVLGLCLSGTVEQPTCSCSSTWAQTPTHYHAYVQHTVNLQAQQQSLALLCISWHLFSCPAHTAIRTCAWCCCNLMQGKMTERNFAQVRREIRLMSIIK